MVGTVLSKRLPFDYVVTPPQIVQSGSATTQLTMMQDSWFELHMISAVTDLDDPNDPAPSNFSVLMTDQTTGRQIASQRVPQSVLTSPQIGGYRLLAPVIFPPMSNVTFDFANLDTGNS